MVEKVGRVVVVVMAVLLRGVSAPQRREPRTPASRGGVRALGALGAVGQTQRHSPAAVTLNFTPCAACVSGSSLRQPSRATPCSVA